MCRIILSAFLIAFAACLIACGGAGTTQPTRGEADADLQAERKEMLAELSPDYISKYTTAENSAEAWVTPKFQVLSFDEKVAIMSLVAADRFNLPRGEQLRRGEYIAIIDDRTGKRIGLYGDYGLNLD